MLSWRRAKRRFSGGSVRGGAARGFLALAAVLLAGCDSGPESPEEARLKFIPEPSVARSAVESILDAWRDAPNPLPNSFDTKSYKFVDFQRKPNQRLKSFEILRVARVEDTMQATVRMVLEPSRSAKPQIVRYIIFGIDPLWIYRLEDYEMISHWEHHEGETSPAEKANGRIAKSPPLPTSNRKESSETKNPPPPSDRSSGKDPGGSPARRESEKPKEHH